MYIPALSVSCIYIHACLNSASSTLRWRAFSSFIGNRVSILNINGGVIDCEYGFP